MDLQTSGSLRPRQAAEYLGIGHSTLWRWAQENPDSFPQPIKIGPRTTVFDIEALKRWRDAQVRKGAK